jgi:DNA polymerase-4
MILHIDMDAFYASVEIRDNPRLRGLPVVVGGSPKGRGVIAAASYEARKHGVYSAMPAAKAKRLCPQLVFVKPRMQHYASVSKAIREIFFRYTSLVEPLALDEAFLDVSGCEKLFGDGPTIAKAVRETIQNELGLTASAGVAPNKFLAKLASDLDKPNGLVVVDPNEIQGFLDPLPISRVWGVGKQTLKKFERIGVQTIKQLRGLTVETMKSLFGINSEHFYRLARGQDSRSVVPDRIAKTISHESTFSHDITEPTAMRAWLLELTDQVARRMRRHSVRGKTVNLKIRFSDFATITRAQTMTVPSASTRELESVVDQIFSRVDMSGRAVRLLGMGVSNLTRNEQTQGMLFDGEEREKTDRLDSIKDQIKDRFGHLAVRRGTSMEHKIGHRPDPRVNDR